MSSSERERERERESRQSPVVSLIIPVYNVENYLAECLDSVLGQTLRDIQIICVNDGSPDGSLAILREYEKKDSRILVIDQPNQGVSAARNAGCKHATGKYLYFVDSDDTIKKELCEKVVAVAETYNADMTFLLYYPGGPSPKACDSLAQWIGKNEPFTIAHHPADWTASLFSGHFWGTYHKLWKTEFWRNNHLSYPEGIRYSEDLVPHWIALLRSPILAFCREELYFYRINPDGLSHTLNVMNDLKSELKSWDVVQSEILKHKPQEEQELWKELLLYKKTEMVMCFFADSYDFEKPELQKRIIEILTKEELTHFRSPEFRKHLADWLHRSYDLHFSDNTVRKLRWHLDGVVKKPFRWVKQWLRNTLKK